MSVVEVAANRRGRDCQYITGSVIDIGCGDFPIEKLYTGITEFKGWDMADGDAQYMIGCKQYDTVHSSNALEHMVDPLVALQNWINIASKYIVLLIPDEEMYEHNTWPSIYNCDHKWSFTLEKSSTLPKSINVHKMLASMKNIEVIKVERITEGYNPKDTRDQTIVGLGAECGIDIILRKVNGST